MTKEKLLEIIISKYENSADFNGLANYELDDYNIVDMIDLINDEMIEVISDRDVLNPHIRAFDLHLTKEHQIETLTEYSGTICFYPLSDALLDVSVDYNKPYTALLQRGKEKYHIIYFNIEILERYINNPQYLIMDYGYRGRICLKDEYCDEEYENEYIKDYGMAYIDGTVFNRAVGVFLEDLSKLSQSKQLLWKSFELADQSKCKIANGFVKNLIEGAWVTTHWIFDVVLEEMVLINKMCESINIPKLFNRTYPPESSERPSGYGNILLPTLKNYYDFISVLEKLIVHNISYKAFTKNAPLIEAIDRKDINGNIKGTLVMLKEWLDKNVKANFDVDEEIILPLKNIRKERQIPAHEFYDNKYDVNIYNQQKELMDEVYLALKALRCLLQGHPLAKTVDIPEHLLESRNIVFY